MWRQTTHLLVKTASWDYLKTPYQYDALSSAYAQRNGPWRVAGVVRLFCRCTTKTASIFLFE